MLSTYKGEELDNRYYQLGTMRVTPQCTQLTTNSVWRKGALLTVQS